MGTNSVQSRNSLSPGLITLVIILGLPDPF